MSKAKPPELKKCVCCLFRVVIPERAELGLDTCIECGKSTQRVMGVREFGHKGESTINIFSPDQFQSAQRAHKRTTYGSNMRKFR